MVDGQVADDIAAPEAAPAPEVSAQAPAPRLTVRGLWKVFGARAQIAAAMELAPSASKTEIQEQTGAVVAVRDVSFEVYPGEVFVVMGLSGSGKSTLVRCLSRLIEPTKGTVEVDGEDVTRYNDDQLREFRRHKIAMVFQHFGLFPHRRVIDNAAYGLEIQGVDKRTRYARALETLDKVGLKGWENHPPRELSGGMQQRVGLARALAQDPEILLMDEPFSGLDPLIRRHMQEELARLQMELHKTIIFITHDLSEALKLGERIAIMRDGAIVQIGSPEDIVLSPEDEYVGEFTRDVRRETILTAARVMGEPRAVVMDYQGPRVALHIMGTNDSPVAMVVDLRHQYKGMLSVEQARQAADAGARRVADCVDTSISPVTADVYFEELLPTVMSTDFPVPVVDEEGRLVGEVHRTAVAAHMGSGAKATGSAQSKAAGGASATDAAGSQAGGY